MQLKNPDGIQIEFYLKKSDHVIFNIHLNLDARVISYNDSDIKQFA